MNLMREALAKKFSPTWVASKSDAQVIAIFKRLQAKGQI